MSPGVISDFLYGGKNNKIASFFFNAILSISKYPAESLTICHPHNIPKENSFEARYNLSGYSPNSTEEVKVSENKVCP